ncbi:DpnI domain-containing protein [Adhaeribacter terreus]|uniref:DpnI domain-containing protein n=1 Tax=Adhaeribacter terreus TaxID=529703 RepID=A0ABW0ECR6_9BACT
MELKLNRSLITSYTSSSQIARVLTEDWVKNNSYCPSCGNYNLISFANNNPVGDFLCNNCESEFELKSKKDSFSLKIVDGAYSTMIQRINSDNNPHFFLLNYSLKSLEVRNFLVIPKHYFVDNIIEKRNPLKETAKRAGWIGCNILLQEIPETGKIFLIKNGQEENRNHVLEKWKKTEFLRNQTQKSRGWTLEVLKLIEKISNNEFDLNHVYKFEGTLKLKFPNNNFIKDKIRQQLQVLRDKGLIEFKGNGNYKKIEL